jgi:hypothetical protein
MSWRLFFSAAILGAALMIRLGAPLLSVAVGIALAGWANHLRVGAARSGGRART